MRSFPRGGGLLEAFGEYVSSRPALVRRLAIHAFVLMAGLFLLLARTSPALAADNGHGQGKAQDHTSASAVMNRHDSPSANNQQHIGGGGDGKGNGGKGNGSGGAAPSTSSGGRHSSEREDTKTGATSHAPSPARSRCQSPNHRKGPN